MAMEPKMMSWSIFHAHGAQGDVMEHLPWPGSTRGHLEASSVAMCHRVLPWDILHGHGAPGMATGAPPPHLVVPPPAPPQILIRNRSTDLDARMGDGSTALILAARLAVEGMVEELIACHADVNAVDETGGCQGVGWVGIPQKFGGWGGSPWGVSEVLGRVLWVGVEVEEPPKVVGVGGGSWGVGMG